MYTLHIIRSLYILLKYLIPTICMSQLVKKQLLNFNWKFDMNFQSERIMEENSIVRDLITKILDESVPTESGR